MKKQAVKVGGKYGARVSGKIVTVMVNSISESATPQGRAITRYSVTNLATNRRLVFSSAAKFRWEVAQ